METAAAAIILAACLYLASGAPLDGVQALVPLADEINRLPTIINPVNYNLTLKPYLLASDPESKRFTFDGELYLTIQANQSTNQLVMHSKNLKYAKREYWLASASHTVYTLPDVQPNMETNIITYSLTNSLAINNTYVVHFVYNGTMDDDMVGFYRSSYTDSKNNTKWLGATQFQESSARRVFPSFDEPRFKATFDVSIIRHKSMKSFSNTRLIQSVTKDNYTTDLYATTPKMSTYLMAFVVSDFNERSNGDFGVIARPEYYQQTEYAFDVGQEILAELDSYFNMPYYQLGNNKMQMIAIPDFAAGAMENWGLLAYRERALLYEKGTSTLSAQQYIATVIAHEQAHMWFGDLVTLEWWGYMWLNEGFARYFQYFAADNVEKHFQLDQQFVVDQIHDVMLMDSTNSSHPMSIDNATDVGLMGSVISYNKGATFIRMMKYVMGDDNFRKSLQEYLYTYNYTNTIPSQLLAIWQKHTPEPFKANAAKMFTSFTEQVGYPLVTFNLTSARTLVISQIRFLLRENDGSNSSLLYTVPITYTTSAAIKFNDTTPKLFIEATTNAQTITLTEDVYWVIGNIQETGYYRVNYDNTSWCAIHHSLSTANWGGIHELNRAQIVDDLFNLACASVIDYDMALNIIGYLKLETNYLPWTAAFNGFNYLVIRLGANIGNFPLYIRDMTEKAYNQLGFEEKSTDTPLDIYNRAKILSWNCKFGRGDCISKAKDYFNRLETYPVPVNSRSVVYCTAMREGNQADFDKLFQMYKYATVATEETLIMNSLGCVKNKTVVEKYFHIIMSDVVRRQDKSSALSSLYSENHENVEEVFDLIAGNLDGLANSMGGYSAVASVISNIASRFTTSEQETKLKTFNNSNKSKFGSSAATLEAAEKTVEQNLLWAKNKLVAFQSYLDKYGSGGGGGSAAMSGFTALTLVLFVIMVKLL